MLSETTAARWRPARNVAPEREICVMQNQMRLANDKLTKDIVYPFANANFLAKHPPLCIEGGEGVYVFDGRGKRYIDGQGGLWNVNAGHGRSEIKRAIVEQLDKLSFYSMFEIGR